MHALVKTEFVMTRMLDDPEIGAAKIQGYWCVPRFKGMLQTTNEFEEQRQGVKRKRSTGDHVEVDTALQQAELDAATACKKLRAEMSTVGLGKCEDVMVADSRVNFPEVGQSKAACVLALQMQRDLRRQAQELQEEEEEFKALVEEHAQDKPINETEKRPKSLDEMRAWAWGVAGQKCANLQILSTGARDKAVSK